MFFKQEDLCTSHLLREQEAKREKEKEKAAEMAWKKGVVGEIEGGWRHKK